MNPESFTGNTYVAALAGAFLGLKAIPGDSLTSRVMNLVLGFITAAFVGPALVDYMHVTSMKVAAGLTFAVGAAGLVAFSAIVEGIKQTPLASIIASWLPKKG